MSDQIVLAKVKAEIQGFPVEFSFEDEIGIVSDRVKRMVAYLQDQGYKAPEPMQINVGRGGFGGGGQKSEIKIEVEKQRLWLLPSFAVVAVKDDKEKSAEKRAAFFAEVARAINVPNFKPEFRPKEKNPYNKYSAYWVPLKFAPLIYADQYFASWEKEALPEGFTES